MFEKPKLKTEEDKRKLANIEAEIAERQEIINNFSQPFRDIMAQINALKYNIEFEKKNSGSDDAVSKKALAQLEMEAIQVDKICREALKKSGELDKFVKLTDRKMALLKDDMSEFQYKPLSISKAGSRR
jgi:hypothetical protein